MLRLLAAVVCLVVMLADATFAAPPRSRSTTRYPRVYGATGRPYGPTQAHYQYRRQYGRPWHGYGGINTSYRFATPYGMSRYRVNRHIGLYGSSRYYASSRYYYGRSVYGFGLGLGCLSGVFYNPYYYAPRYVYPQFATYGPVYPTSPYRAIITRSASPNPVGVMPPAAPRQAAINPGPINNAAIRDALKTQPLLTVRPSSLAAKRKSIRLRLEGDALLQQREYTKARAKYRAAIHAAGDMAEPRLCLGFAFAGTGQFSSAADSFKKGLQLDPEWPVSGRSLTSVFGRENNAATSAIIAHVTKWAKADLREPDRLFLLGLFLHFANRTDSANDLFQAAQRLGGRTDHLIAFLEPLGKPVVPEPPAPKLPSEQRKLLVPLPKP